MSQHKRYRIAVDIGGTFVDAIELDQQTGEVRLAKAPTTPARPADGVMDAISRLGTPLAEVETFVHGTTLGLNAIIERRGATTGIITNLGFEDVFEVGRADVPGHDMFNFAYEKGAPLVKRRHRVGIGGRLEFDGSERDALDEASVIDAAQRLRAAGVEAIAVCLLHSYRNAAHEERVAELVRQSVPELPVSISCEITREYREYERTTTTVLDAYIRPIYERYIDALGAALTGQGFTGRFLIMRSSGGAMTAKLAAKAPIFTVMSGPAGGMIGTAELARVLGKNQLLTLDYGGTSLDASLIENQKPIVMHEASMEHFPVLMPIFDIRCIGTGGGSIARVEHGLLQVGPQSAGSVPGPVAYGRGGTEPTTTDCSLALGYLDPDGFLGGKMKLDGAASLAAIESKLAGPLGTDATAVAAGVFEVLMAKTVGAVREITVDRGRDPSEFSLVAFGGAGPMIAPLLGREIDVVELIVPRVPAAFSAYGMLMSDITSDFAQTDIRPLNEANRAAIEAGFEKLAVSAREQLGQQGFAAGDCVMECTLDLRYAGQEHALKVEVANPLDVDAAVAAFNAQHQERYGHTMPDTVEIVALRVRGVGRLAKPAMQRLAPASGGVETALKKPREAFDFATRKRVPFAIYDRDLLAPGHSFEGPAIVEEGTSNTVIHGDQSCRVNDYGHLIITTRRNVEGRA